MIYEEEADYIMRMIKEMARVLFSLMLGKKYTQVELPKENKFSVSGKGLEDFTGLADQGKINEAENILLEGLREGDRAYFEMSLLFYEKLSGKTDEFLAGHGYSREEVVDGLKYVVNYYGYTSLLEAFTEDIDL